MTPQELEEIKKRVEVTNKAFESIPIISEKTTVGEVLPRLLYTINCSLKSSKDIPALLSYIDSLHKQIEEAREVIGFYGSTDTWCDKELDSKGNLFCWGKKIPHSDVSIVRYSIGESNGNFHCLGKRSRAYLAKYPERSEDSTKVIPD